MNEVEGEVVSSFGLELCPCLSFLLEADEDSVDEVRDFVSALHDKIFVKNLRVFFEESAKFEPEQPEICEQPPSHGAENSAFDRPEDREDDDADHRGDRDGAEVGEESIEGYRRVVVRHPDFKVQLPVLMSQPET